MTQPRDSRGKFRTEQFTDGTLRALNAKRRKHDHIANALHPGTVPGPPATGYVEEVAMAVQDRIHAEKRFRAAQSALNDARANCPTD